MPVPNVSYEHNMGLQIEFTGTECVPQSPALTTNPTVLDVISAESPFEAAIKHVFSPSGSRSRPLRMDVNGRRGRRAICVLYGDNMRYEVLDMDAAMEEEEEEDPEGELEED